MKSFKILAVVGLALAMYGSRVALAQEMGPNPPDGLTIIVNEQTGLGYYQMDIGGVLSPWTALSPVVQGSWDMQKTTHGGSTAVGTTEDFEIDNISFMTGGATYTIEDTTNSNGSGSWRNNIASYTPMDIGYSMGVYNYSGFNNNDETTESALIVANGTSATSKVSNLVVLDNGGQASSGILVYNPNGTPTQGASTPQQVSAYGYTNGTYSATGNGTPITEVGTPTTGLEGDLENDNSAQDGGPNQNFAGDATGDNIAVGVEGVVTDPDNGKQYAGYELAADPESDVYGSELVAGDDPAQLFIYKNGGSSVYYISPTIIFEAYAVPLPSPFWCGLGLMGILGLVKLRASGRIEA